MNRKKLDGRGAIGGSTGLAAFLEFYKLEQWGKTKRKSWWFYMFMDDGYGIIDMEHDDPWSSLNIFIFELNNNLSATCQLPAKANKQ